MSEINWNAIAAIGQCLGALATFLAVIVALKTSKKTSTVKIKVRVTTGYLVFNNSLGEVSIIYEAVNIGLIPTTLVSTGIQLPNQKQLIFTNLVNQSLPKELKPSESIQHYIPISEFINALEANGFKGKIKLEFYFGDNRNNRYYTKWKFNTTAWK